MKNKQMKIILSAAMCGMLCAASGIASGCSNNSSNEPVTYAVVSPYNDSDVISEGIENRDDAKALCDQSAHYGYVVYDSAGRFIYSPAGSLNSSKMVYEARKIADYIYKHDYNYGNASVNPATAWKDDNCERLVSCDRFVGWVLYNVGYTEGHPSYGFTWEMIPFLREQGFKEIKNEADVRAGDIVFVGTENDKEPYHHVYLCAGPAGDGLWYRYDMGSDRRIDSVQPFSEPISYYPERQFCAAFRIPD